MSVPDPFCVGLYQMVLMASKTALQKWSAVFSSSTWRRMWPQSGSELRKSGLGGRLGKFTRKPEAPCKLCERKETEKMKLFIAATKSFTFDSVCFVFFRKNQYQLTATEISPESRGFVR